MKKELRKYAAVVLIGGVFRILPEGKFKEAFAAFITSHLMKL